MTGEKASTKKKLSKLAEIKKPLIISGLVAVFAISGILGGIYLFREEKKPESVLHIGLDDWFLNSWDPLYNPDDASFTPNTRVWAQIVEGLFEFNQSREDTPMIPCLAKDFGTWSSDDLNFTVSLKEKVRFHDGTPFNAEAVKWNFDRLHWIIENKDSGDTWVWAYMYFLPDARYIINETVVLDEYTVRFVLNDVYAPFRSLLSAATSFFLSPTSTPEDDFVDRYNGKMVGTGPFVLEWYNMVFPYGLCGNITLKANRHYWGGKPKIDIIHFEHISDEDIVAKMLTGRLHFTSRTSNSTHLEILKNTSNLTAISYIHPTIFVIAMNYDLFPLEMRKAISYAFNYSDYIKILFDDKAIRCKSPLSKGMLYSRWDLNVPYTNLTIARQILIDVSWPGTAGLTANDNISAGNEWEKLVEDDTPLAVYNFSIEEGVETHILLASLIAKYLKQIGVKVIALNLTSQEYIEKLINGGMEFWRVGWGPAFNDPVEMINPLYHTEGWYNHYNLSDSQLDTWIEQGIIETNETLREQIYYNIQKRLVEELYPVVWTHSYIYWHVWASSVKGIPVEGGQWKFILKYASFE